MELHISQANQTTLSWLKSTTEESADGNVFQIVAKKATRGKYQAIWLSVLGMVLKVHMQTSSLLTGLSLHDTSLTTLMMERYMSTLHSNASSTSYAQPVLDISIVLISQTTLNSVFESLLFVWFAVQGWHAERKVFLEPGRCTSTIAALQYYIRLVFYERYWLGESAHGLSAQSQAMLHHRKSMITHTSWSPMSYFLRVLDKAKQFSQADLERLLSWSHDHSSVSHNHCTVVIQDLKNFAVKMIHELEDHVEKQLLLTSLDALSATFLASLTDSIGKDSKLEGLDTMVRRSNPMLYEKCDSHVLQQLNEKYKLGFLASGQIGSQDACTARGLTMMKKSMLRMLEMLAVAIHMFSGQPMRSPELFSLTFRTRETAERNIVLQNGLIYCYTTYSRISRQYSTAKPVLHVLPFALTRIVMAYVTWVLPAYEYFLDKIRGQDQVTLSAFLFAVETEHLKDDRLSAAMEKYSCLGMQQRVTVRPWRHIAIEIGHALLKISMDQDEDIEDDKNEVDFASASAHSALTASTHYALLAGSHRLLGDGQLGKHRDICVQWQTFLGIILTRLVQKSLDPTTRTWQDL